MCHCERKHKCVLRKRGNTLFIVILSVAKYLKKQERDFGFLTKPQYDKDFWIAVRIYTKSARNDGNLQEFKF